MVSKPWTFVKSCMSFPCRLSLSAKLNVNYLQSNARTAHLQPSLPTPTLITISPDRTFTFTFRSPPTSYLLKKAAGIEKGTGAPISKPNHGKITLKHVHEIARIKCEDEHLAAVGEYGVARQILGTAKSLGIDVVP